MSYIHKFASWPRLIWNQQRIASVFGTVRNRQGRLIGRMGALGFPQRSEALLQTLTLDVVKSSEIEGEILDRGQVRSSLARRLGMGGMRIYDILEKTQKNTDAAAQGIDITVWLEWFLSCLNRALDATEITLAGVFRKASFWKFHPAGSINDRQRIIVNKLLDGLEGKLTSSKWAKIAKCSQHELHAECGGTRWLADTSAVV